MRSDANNVLSQRSVAGGPAFHFNDHHLEYFGDRRDFKTKYEEIGGPTDYRRRKASDRVMTLTFGFLMVFALVMLSRDHGPHFGPEGLHRFLQSFGVFVCILIAVCVPLHYLTQKEYTVIPSRNGNILVVRDRQHDAILQRLQIERLKALRLLSAPDPANSPQEEAAKLKWLHDEGAITEDEYRHLCPQMAT